MDKPLKEGRKARYVYRHLLQVLVVRRLLAEGYSTGSIISKVVNLEDTELQALLQGEWQLMLEAPNPALAFLEDLNLTFVKGGYQLSFVTSGSGVAAPHEDVPCLNPSKIRDLQYFFMGVGALKFFQLILNQLGVVDSPCTTFWGY